MNSAGSVEGLVVLSSWCVVVETFYFLFDHWTNGPTLESFEHCSPKQESKWGIIHEE